MDAPYILFFAVLSHTDMRCVASVNPQIWLDCRRQCEPVPCGCQYLQLTTIPEPFCGCQPVCKDDALHQPATMQPAELNGTVPDVNGDLFRERWLFLKALVPGIIGQSCANDNGFFQFDGPEGGAFRIESRPSAPKDLRNGFLRRLLSHLGSSLASSEIKLKLEASVSSVTVYSSTEQIATEQVELAEQQRILGFIPNFYVVYDSKNAVPLTTKLKFQMAYRVSIDPVSILGQLFWLG